MHKLLQRQLKRLVPSETERSKSWRQLLAAVNQAYHDADDDRALLERSLELASAELVEKNRQLRLQSANLRQANQELRQFAYVASHDLRAPLRAVKQLSLWIEEDLHGRVPDEVQEKMSLLRRRVARMDAFIAALLRYSRAGRDDPELERVDTTVLVTEIVEMLSPAATMHIEAVAPMPVLVTAKLPLWEVLLNLISNAVKHHDKQTGCIRVEVEEAGPRYVFSVIDDGPGIPNESVDRVFEMFHTLRPRDEQEATGMGLALSRKLVEQAGGKLSVAAATPRGASFRFSWPRVWPRSRRK